MNILYVLHTDGLAGANRSALQLIKGIKEKDASLIIYVIIPAENDIIRPILEDMGCHVLPENFTNCTTVMHGIRESIRYFIISRGYSRIYEEIKDLGIDIVHTNTSVCDLGAYLAKRLKVPHIWHVRENLKYYKMSVIRPHYYKKLISSDDARIVCISRYLEEIIRKEYNSIHSTVIYNAIETPGCKLIKDDDDKINMIISGMIVKNKGIEDAINALDLIVNSYGMRNVFLKIVGTMKETVDYEKFLRDIVHNCGIEDYVEFLPFTDQIDTIRSGCDIALQCSVMEGLGRVTIEAMLDRLIVIGADSGATKELIREGFNGWLYEPGDAKGLAQMIRTVLTLSKTEKEKVIENAYLWAHENFSVDEISGKFIRLYRSVIKTDER